MASSSSETSSLYLSMSSSSNGQSATPALKQQKRKPSPALPTQPSLGPPSPALTSQKPGRPPSPLRNGYIPNTFTGIEGHDNDVEEDDNDVTWRTPSPTSSVSQFAANIAQRVGSFVGNIAPRSLPTQAEIEAEAERERDRSRKEAERILTQEAEERRLVEERVFAMMQTNRGNSPKSLPPPPGRSQTLSNPPSPATSQKESAPSWWIAAKNRLTPTKEPLTPAQQIIQETKAREKEKKNNKGKEKEKEWPATPQVKYQDPAYLNLALPIAPPQRRPVPVSPSSPTPSRTGHSIMPPNLTPSPMRSSTASSSSPTNESSLLYAQFNAQGTLDIPGTLLTIAKRFEKLEKWTVGHVRALEERMGDVEKWLVEKEREKEIALDSEERGDGNISQSAVTDEIHDIREDVSELQGRVGELGRELAKLATAPANLSSAPSRQSAQISVAPQTTSSHAVRSLPAVTPQTPRLGSSTARESTSPPTTSKSSTTLRARLPYPSGDYASSHEMAISSPASSPSSVTSATRQVSISGLPSAGLGASQSPSSVHPSSSPSGPALSPTQKSAPVHSQSISPTPRKRYTVALGGPITAPSEPSGRGQRPSTPVSFLRGQAPIGTAVFSASPVGVSDDDADSADDTSSDGQQKDMFQDDTIGKSAAAKLSQAANNFNNNANAKNTKPSPSGSPQSSPPAPRIRAQSVYGLSSLHSQSLKAPTQQLARMRPRSTDRLGLGFTDGEGGNLMSPTGNNFVDPLALRKQERPKIAMPVPGRGKVAVGQLVAFFDGDKRERD